MAAISELLKTPLYEQHKQLGGRLVDFGGWALPANYGSQVEEHHSVRNQAGMFDVSHMTVSDVTGADTLAYLSRLLANDIAKVATVSGKALYSCMLNEQGGVIDDLIVYYLNDTHCRIVSNAATNEKDMAWLQRQAQDFSELSVVEKPDLALIAVQGPEAIAMVKKAFPGDVADCISSLARFQGGFVGDTFIGRTGYTGEDGLELIIPANEVVDVWQTLNQAGVPACGLGARDTLRLEAGMALYGNDLDEEHTPLESGLSWTVAMKDKRNFIGRSVLNDLPNKKMIGLVLEQKGVLRAGQAVVFDGDSVGEITSGTFSPTLGQSIALARIKNIDAIKLDTPLQVSIRNKTLDARVVKYPFVKK